MKLWKIQKFVGDVVYDLRQRGLLPIVVLLLVGMVAVPVLIAGGGSKVSSSSTDSVVSESAELAPETQKAVVAYDPGVRDYKERLNHLTAKDPFQQQFVQSAAAASQLSTSVGGSSTTSTGSAGTGTTTSEPGSEVTPGVGGKAPDSGGSSGGGSTKTEVRYFYYTTDLEVGEAAWTLQRRNGVKPLTPLPSEGIPIAIYLGATLDGKQALFLLSTQVTQVVGAGQCLPSPTDCAMLSLRPGQSSDMLYGPDGKTYRLKVIRNRRIISSKPPHG